MLANMNKLKLLLPTILLFSLVAPVLANGDTTAPAVDIVNLPSLMNKTEFVISYTALDSGSGLKDVVFAYHREGQPWENLTTLTTNSGKFNINATQIIQDTKYFFSATACDNSGNCAADYTENTIDRIAPPKPENFAKDKTTDNNYRIRWHNSDSDDLYQVYVYRSNQAGFTADSSSQVGTINVTKNTDSEWNNAVPQDGKIYYYILRSLDKAGNASDAVGDIQVTSTTTSTVTTAPTGQPVTGQETLQGKKLVLTAQPPTILGEETTATQPAETIQVLPTATPGSIATAVQAAQKSPLFILLGAVAALGILIYLIAFRKK